MTSTAPLTLADRQRLAVDYLPLARAMTRRFVSRHRIPGQFEEFEAAALAALWDAARKARGSGESFAGYARRRIAGRLHDHRHWLSGSRRTEKGWEAGAPLHFDSTAEASTGGGFDAIDLRDEQERFVARLPDDLRAMASRIVLDRQDRDEAAQDLGLSAGRAKHLWRLIRDHAVRYRAAS